MLLRRTLSLHQLRATLIKAIKDSKETVRRAEESGPTSHASTDQGLAELQGARFVPPLASETRHFDIRIVAAFGSEGHWCVRRSCPCVPHGGVAGSRSPKCQYPPPGPRGHLPHDQFSVIVGVGTDGSWAAFCCSREINNMLKHYSALTRLVNIN